MGRLKGVLLVVFAGALLCTPLEARRRQDPPASLQLPRFVVTLALGDNQPGPSGTFSPAAMRALADMKGFLPYTRYTALDTVYLIGLGGPNQQLRGVEDRPYDLLMRGKQLSPMATNIELLRLFAMPSPQHKSPPGIVIEASFKIQSGETVVVGTSRLDGNRALILIVTAASR